jgi:hypothetical protein
VIIPSHSLQTSFVIIFFYQYLNTSSDVHETSAKRDPILDRQRKKYGV